MIWRDHRLAVDVYDSVPYSDPTPLPNAAPYEGGYVAIFNAETQRVLQVRSD